MYSRILVGSLNYSQATAIASEAFLIIAKWVSTRQKLPEWMRPTKKPQNYTALTSFCGGMRNSVFCRLNDQDSRQETAFLLPQRWIIRAVVCESMATQHQHHVSITNDTPNLVSHTIHMVQHNTSQFVSEQNNSHYTSTSVNCTFCGKKSQWWREVQISFVFLIRTRDQTPVYQFRQRLAFANRNHEWCFWHFWGPFLSLWCLRTKDNRICSSKNQKNRSRDLGDLPE